MGVRPGALTRRELLRLGATVAFGPTRAVVSQYGAATLAAAVESVRSFGALGNGVADDTGAIQQTIERVNRLGGGTVVFPAGTYLVRSLQIYPGITYRGQQAVLKRPNDPERNHPRALRMMTTQRDLYAGDADSRPLVLTGLTFDGNVDYQGPKEATDQAHLVFLWGDERRRGRLRVTIDGCTFRNSPADAITIYKNIDATIANTVVHNCRRGALIINGGYSRVNVVNFRATRGSYNPRISMETPGLGYGGSAGVDVTMRTVYCEGSFEMDIHGGKVDGANLSLVGPIFNVYGRGEGVATFRDSLIHVGPFEGNRIQAPGQLTFENCQFHAWKDSTVRNPHRELRALNIRWDPHKGHRNQTVRVVRSTFTVDRSTLSTGDAVVAISTQIDPAGLQNRLMVEGGTIAAEYDIGLKMERGGTWTVRDMTINAPTGLKLNAPQGYPLDVLLENLTLRGTKISRRLSGEGSWSLP
jgi:hypothetical protein